MSPAQAYRPFKGLAAEHQVVAELIRKRCCVFLPVRPMSSHADILIELEDKLFSVQVKSFPLSRKAIARLFRQGYDVVATVNESDKVQLVTKHKNLANVLHCKVHEFYA